MRGDKQERDIQVNMPGLGYMNVDRRVEDGNSDSNYDDPLVFYKRRTVQSTDDGYQVQVKGLVQAKDKRRTGIVGAPKENIDQEKELKTAVELARSFLNNNDDIEDGERLRNFLGEVESCQL